MLSPFDIHVCRNSQFDDNYSTCIIMHVCMHVIINTCTLSSIQTPDIDIVLPEGGLKLYQQATIKMSFMNPLGKRLTGGRFALSGEGRVQDVTTDIP